MLRSYMLVIWLMALALCSSHSAMAQTGGSEFIVTPKPLYVGATGGTPFGSSALSPFQTTGGSGGSLGGFQAGNGGNFLPGSALGSGGGSILGGGSSGGTSGGSIWGGGTSGGSIWGGGTSGGSGWGNSITPANQSGSFGGGAIGDVLCNVVYWFLGSLGQGIATLSVITLGIGALMGKVSQGTALTTMVGISVIFGAPNIVQELTGVAACY